jgi:hypothetical protein
MASCAFLVRLATFTGFSAVSNSLGSRASIPALPEWLAGFERDSGYSFFVRADLSPIKVAVG